MRVCDYIANFLYTHGIKDVFMVSGGGMMFLSDGLACDKRINVVCCHHEQAVAMSAVSYAKYKGLGCAYVTTGCGGTNAITGILNAWQDNTPCFFISGQCKKRETLRYTGLHIRQIGVQEADIISIVQSITKYSVMVIDPYEISYHLEKAYYLTMNGRPGPVWIDVPMDVQSAEIEISKLRHFSEKELYLGKKSVTDKEIKGLIKDLSNSKRPIILAGQGVRISGAIEAFDKLVHKHNIPFVCSRLGTDLIPTTDKLNIGRIGNKGMRSANFALQNSDLVLVLGSRLSVSSTGQEYQYFAREAKVIVVDIDKYEHTKNTVHIEQLIISDVKDVLDKLILPKDLIFSKWANICLNWKNKYPVCLSEHYDDSNGISMYAFVNELSKILKEDSVVVGDAGSAVYIPPQALQTNSYKQRYITSGGQAEMGYSLPAAVGISIAKNNGEVFAVTGDGSLQMNIQELQTLVYYNLPVKLFVWNNDGYSSIRATQRKFFNGRFIGTDKSSGVSFPELKKIADAYGICYIKIESLKNIHEQLKKVSAINGPVLCEVMCIKDENIIPSVSSRKNSAGIMVSSPIEDMYPLLDRAEFKKEMIIPVIED